MRDASTKIIGKQPWLLTLTFFCKVIRLVYRSKKETGPPREFSEQEKAIAENAYKLLDKWKTPPGTAIG